MEEVVVSALAFDKNQVKVSVLDLPDVPGIAAKMFGQLAKGGINVDMIIQSAAREKANDISFTVSKPDLKKTLELLEKGKKELKFSDTIFEDNVAKVSIIGVGMRSHPGVAAKMFDALSKLGINIGMISTSEIKISVVIRLAELTKAVTELHAVFGLDAKKKPATKKAPAKKKK